MKKIVSRLAGGRVLVSDGAWGTFLQQKGLKPGECPEEWCLTRPAEVREIAKAYFDAGADMVETNSFGASRIKLGHYGLADRAAGINEAAARLSREAAGPDRLVIASLGPTGKLLVMNDVTEEELYTAFREQAIGFENGGADAVCIETMSDIAEACLAIRAVRENTGLEIICTFTYERTADGGYRTMMGVSPEDGVRASLEAGADIVGANCGNGLERMIDIVGLIRRIDPAAPVLIHANAGIPSLVGDRSVFPESPRDMASLVPKVIAAGANVVGGCCGTTPEHIRQIRAAVDSFTGGHA